MINKLIKIADSLDAKGYNKEADVLDAIIKKALPSEDRDRPVLIVTYGSDSLIYNEAGKVVREEELTYGINYYFTLDQNKDSIYSSGVDSRWGDKTLVLYGGNKGERFLQGTLQKSIEIGFILKPGWTIFNSKPSHWKMYDDSLETGSMMGAAKAEEYRREEAAIKERIDRAIEELNNTAAWFNANVFIGMEDQWPLTVDRDLIYSFESNDPLEWEAGPYASDLGAKVIRKGTVYTGVSSQGDHPQEAEGAPALDLVHNRLRRFAEKNNLKLSDLQR